MPFATAAAKAEYDRQWRIKNRERKRELVDSYNNAHRAEVRERSAQRKRLKRAEAKAGAVEVKTFASPSEALWPIWLAGCVPVGRVVSERVHSVRKDV